MQDEMKTFQQIFLNIVSHDCQISIFLYLLIKILKFDDDDDATALFFHFGSLSIFVS